MIFRQGEPGDVMYLVQDGEVVVLNQVDGVDQEVAVLERGDFFGEMAILEQARRTLTVRAKSDARLVKIDRKGLEHLLARNPEIGVRMLRKLARRAAGSEKMLVDAWSGALQPPAPPAAEPEGPPPAQEAPTVSEGGEAASSATKDAFPRPAKLVFHEDGTVFELSAGAETAIGRRDPANNILPEVDLTTVDTQYSTSRRHAKILRRDDGFFLVEEKATNGTFVNGTRLTAGEPHPLQKGDEVTFGVVRMHFFLG